MVLLPTGHKTDLIFIETKEFELHIKGKIGNRKANAIDANKNTPAQFGAEYSRDTNITVKTISSDGELVENTGYVMCPSFFEEGEYELLLIKKQEQDLVIHHMSREITNSFQAIQNVIFGSFNFNGEIGISTFYIYSGTERIFTLTIEVFPAKMDYLKDYKAIMYEVNEEIASLAFDFLAKTTLHTALKDVPYQTSTEFYHIIKIIFDKLIVAIERIARFPKHNVVNTQRLISPDKAKRISKANTQFLRKHPQLLYPSERGMFIQHQSYMPVKVIEERKESTIDIYENRLVKYMIKNIFTTIKQIKEKVAYSYGKDTEQYKTLNSMESKLSQHLNTFFSSIGELTGRKSMSLVFKMASGYKEVYYYYQLLKKGLSISDDLYQITPKKIWKLYEIWCYIKLHHLLKDLGYEVMHYGIIKTVDQGLYITLSQDNEAMMEYADSEGNRLELWYNKRYSHLPTTSQRPDTVLAIRKKGAEDKIYILDAKYRLQIYEDGTVGPMEEDINVMHRYRDAIVSELNEGLQFKYSTFGAYVMFPISNEKEYQNHRYYKSIDKVNIGAFPMLPGSTALMEAHLKNILAESNVESAQKLITHDDYDDYARFKLENVMVANVKDPNHLETYIKHQFYHIPTRTLQHVRLGVEYIAFYGSKEKFDTSGGIRFYAKIRNYRVYKRSECVEIPKNSDDLYIRFELDEIIEVGPIATVEYGLQTVMYTTLYLLQNAQNIHELKLKSREEIALYKKLKWLSQQKDIVLKRYRDYYTIDQVKIQLLDGRKIRIEKDIFTFKEGLKKMESIYG